MLQMLTLTLKLAVQLVTVNQSMDQKLESVSTTLMSRFVLMLEEFKSGLNQTSFSEDPAVLGPSISQAEPPSLQHPVSTKCQEGLRFWGSVDDPVPHGSSLAHQKVVDLARHSVGVMAEAARDPLSEGGEKSQRPGYQSGQGFQFGVQTETGFAYHLEDEKEEDRESVADPPLKDRTYARLIDFIYNRFAHSQPSASANAPSRCEFEDFFAVADPPSAARHNLTVYPRVAEIVDSSAERASLLARESCPLHRVVPLRRKMFFVGDNTNYCNVQFVNPDFSRISKHKTIHKTRTSG